MTDLDDLPFDYPATTAPNPAATRRSCIHPRAMRRLFEGGVACGRCGKELDPERQARGRRSRNRGNSIERWVNTLLGIANRGKFGGPDDGGGEADWICVQTKSGGVYPERIDAILRSLPVKAGQLRGVVHVDTPGPGIARRALITLDLRDFASWYGNGGPTDASP